MPLMYSVSEYKIVEHDPNEKKTNNCIRVIVYCFKQNKYWKQNLKNVINL